VSVRRAVLCPVLAICIVAIHSTEAYSCPMPVRIDPATRALNNARSHLRAGWYDAVAPALAEEFPGLRTTKLDRRRPARFKLRRALKLLALTIVRSDGMVGNARWYLGTRALRRENIRWAVGTLRDLLAQAPHDASLQSALGEALALRPATQDEGLRLMLSLVKRKRLKSAHGFGALAELLNAAGRVAERDRAVARCVAIGGPCPLFRKDR